MSSKALSLVLAVVILTGAALVARHVHSTSNKPLPAGQSKPQPTTTTNGDVNDKGDGGNKTGDGELQDNQSPSVRGLIYPEVVDIATKLKNNIPDLLHFVSDAIRNEPYDGALRGSRGTLLAGAGDSADKAILLRDLLHIAVPQSQVRFASCSLTLEQATQLIASSQTPDGMAPATGLTKPTLAGGQAKKSAPSKINKVAIEAMTSDWRDLGNTVRQNATAMQAKLSQQGVTVTNALLTQSQLVEAVRAHDPSLRSGKTIIYPVPNAINWLDTENRGSYSVLHAPTKKQTMGAPDSSPDSRVSGAAGIDG